MKKQLTFSLISDELAQAKTSKKEFLEKIERIIPFDEWVEIIRPCYYNVDGTNEVIYGENIRKQTIFLTGSSIIGIVKQHF